MPGKSHQISHTLIYISRRNVTQIHLDIRYYARHFFHRRPRDWEDPLSSCYLTTPEEDLEFFPTTFTQKVRRRQNTNCDFASPNGVTHRLSPVFTHRKVMEQRNLLSLQERKFHRQV